MSGDHLALDIETIPAREISEYSTVIQEKIQTKVSRIRERNPDYSYNHFASIHGDFSRIICISLGYITNENQIKLKSICGDDEAAILQEFNKIIKSFKGVFIHYNGLNFDCPTLLQRMSHNGIKITNNTFKILRRYSQEPHFDLMMHYYNWDLQKALPLGILAELHKMPSPKEDISGSQVLETYKNGEWDRISHYCEFDVATTLNLWNKIYRFKSVIPETNYIFSNFK